MWVNWALHFTGTKNILPNLIIGLYRNDGLIAVEKNLSNAKIDWLLRFKFQPTEPYILPIQKRQQQNKLYKFKVKPPTNHTQTNPKNDGDQTF